MFYRALDEGNTWMSALLLVLGLSLSILGVVAALGFMAIEIGIV